MPNIDSLPLSTKWIELILCGPAIYLGLLGCGSPREPVRIDVQVIVDNTQISQVTTDLGYTVQVTEARIAVRDFTFAIAGEPHASLLFQKTYEWLVPAAQAHPGHYQAGDITGEMPGNYLLNWLPAEETTLGTASLLVGRYHSANFVFARATEADLEEGDALIGHTAIFRGVAEKASSKVSFLALIDSPVNRQLVGIPAEFDIEDTSDVALHLQLETLDQLQGDTLFDGLDFLKLDDNTDGELEIVSNTDSDDLAAAYNLLRRTFQTHDHFEVVAVSD